MKRILVVSQHYWPENFKITDICKGFTDDGITVDVLCGIPNYPKGEWFEGYTRKGPRYETHEGIEIFRAGEVRRKGNTNVRIFLNYIAYPLTAMCNLPRLRKRRYDAVFCYNTSPVLMMMPAILCARLRHIPLTTYVLDLWPENLYSVLPIQNKFLRWSIQTVSHFLYRRSERLIAMSPALGEKLRAQIPGAKLAVIPQYCEDFYFQDVQDTALAARFHGRFTVLFAGNISPAQDLGLLVTCAARLQQAQRTDIHFVIVGDGMSRSALEAEISAQGLTDWFTFEGQQPVTRIPAYHTMASALFGALAKSEDIGLTIPAKITSYLAAGRPCLIAMDGEGARVVQEAQGGLVSPAANADALYENLLTLAAMPQAQRDIMGENARSYCHTHFSRRTLLTALERFILNGQE